jgi:hypothetical protein
MKRKQAREKKGKRAKNRKGKNMEERKSVQMNVYKRQTVLVSSHHVIDQDQRLNRKVSDTFLRTSRCAYAIRQKLRDA